MTTTTSNKRIMIGNIAYLAALLILSTGCWHEIEWYEIFAPLGTLISFLCLTITFFCYVDISKALKDPEVYIMAAGDVIAFICLIIVKSNMGAILTVANLLMMLYLSDKIKLSKKLLVASSLYVAFFYYYWTFDVKGYFKGYNTNYGGLVLITGFVFAILAIVYIREKLIGKGNKKAYYAMLIPYLFMFAWGYNIIAWYRARCAFLGLLVMAVLSFVPRKLWDKKWMYNLLVFAMTGGAILISLIYVGLGRIKDVFSIRIFYKDIISGREEIWSELWQEYMKKPLTGIGSAYVMKLPWMEGMFEVHNGLLDILIVHGVLVFAIAVYFLAKRLLSLRKYCVSSEVRKIAMSGIMTILATSFMENFFIVPPFTLCLLLLFVVVVTDEEI